MHVEAVSDGGANLHVVMDNINLTIIPFETLRCVVPSVFLANESLIFVLSSHVHLCISAFYVLSLLDFQEGFGSSFLSPVQ